MNHGYVGSEHLVFGITQEGSLNKVFQPLHVTAEKVVSKIREVVRFGKTTPNLHDLVLSPYADMAIDQAVHTAIVRNHLLVTPYHLLWGITEETEGMGREILRTMGIDITRVQDLLIAEFTLGNFEMEPDEREN